MQNRKKTREQLELELGELQKAYDELLIKEERYRLLTEHARDVIWTMKIDGTITYLSPAIEKVRGLTVEEAMNQTIDQIHTPESAAISIRYVQELYADYVAGLPLKSFRGELDYYRKDGSIFQSEVIVYPIPGDDLDSLILLGVSRDITERKQFEAKLYEQAKKLEELNATKDKFFSIIAHDLRSPFNGILALSDMLKKRTDELDSESTREYSELIHTTAKQAFELLENLLNWASTQQGSFPYSPKKLFLNDLISRELEHLKSIADQKHITLAINTNDELVIEADKNMMETVVRNLISNAIKFTHSNGLVTVNATMTDGGTEIIVSDNGMGMNEGTLENLFEINKGKHIPGTKNEKGSGLGLIICKEFVERHGGSISVESQLGKGSSFRILLPMKSSVAI
jgi:PAS domain S-box-containing protein